MIELATYAYIAALALWATASLLRLVGLYDRDGPLQRWRQFDIFNLVPVGAFFSPNPPPSEFTLLVRDLLPSGRLTAWTEAPTITPRRWRDAFWSHKKHLYRARLDVVRCLLQAASAHESRICEASPATMMSEAYLALLRYATSLPRLAPAAGIQFAALERELPSGRLLRAVLSAMHAP
jgi:hypothetical protein